MHGFDQIVHVLLAAGANIDLQEQDEKKSIHSGDTPLHLAVWKDHLSTVKILISNGASLKLAKSNGETAFAITFYNILNTQKKNALEIFKYFVKNGGDLNTINYGKTVFQIANKKGLTVSKTCGGICENSYKKEEALVDATATGNLEVVKFLLKYVDPNSPKIQKNGEKTYALHQAAMHGFDQIVHVLLAAGANIDLQEQDEKKSIHSGDTPLHLAVWKDHLSTVKILISNGASLKLAKSNGETAFAITFYNILHTQKKNALEIFKYFVKNGGDLNTINYGKTVFQIAKENGLTIPADFF